MVKRIGSELAASWLWLIAIGGVVMWGGRYRQMTRRGTGRARLLSVDRSVAGRARTVNWHGATGMWIANLVYGSVNAAAMLAWLLMGRWARSPGPAATRS